MIQAQSPRHEPRVDPFARADGDVEAFVDDVDQTVAVVEIQFDLGILSHETGQRRGEKTAENRQADPQLAARRGPVTRQLTLHIADFLENPSAALQQHLAFRRQRDAPRASMEQAHTQVCLEAGNRLADGRRGQPEDAPSLREAARFRRVDEGGEGAKAVQGGHLIRGKEGYILLPSALSRQSQATATSACAG